MSTTTTLENLARKYLPPSGARLAKRFAVWPRYRAQAKACREGFRLHGQKYTQPVLFVAGLPKSGTTWLEKMISSYPGFHELLIPEVAAHELATGGSHDYELPDNMFERFKDMLVLTKMHVHGSPHNADVLRRAGVRYAILFRDLRDVAVSNYFYVRNTPWHGDHPHYAGKSVEDGLLVFAERTLAPYAHWVRSWNKNRDPNASVILRYEQMLADPRSSVRQVADLFDLPRDEQTIQSLVDRFSFKNMSGGRDRGEQSATQFVRKGVAGDWVNHFTPRVRDAFKQRAGDFFIEFGYEKDLNW
ncbi:MAG: sulfotransferase domain-containing protein [Phycisphaeraceae bacterium]|nr:MAG: sulfotransferase domain-containing protein [Phycisphaeraceae bacterium]